MSASTTGCMKASREAAVSGARLACREDIPTLVFHVSGPVLLTQALAPPVHEL